MRPGLRLVGEDERPTPSGPLGLEAAFREFSRYVAGIAHRILGRPDEVDDVVQDVFMAAERGLGRLEQPEAIRGWLATVTVRVAWRRLRRRRLRMIVGLDDARDHLDVASPDASPEERLLVARIYDALDDLPVAERLAWSLRHLEGERLERVADLCGCSLATAKRRIAAAHERLREVIDG